MCKEEVIILAGKPPITALTNAMKACKGRKGCDYASCMKEEGVKAPHGLEKKDVMF